MNDFDMIERNGVKLYTVSSFEKTDIVKTGFSTRVGGVSEGRFASLNFSFITGDERENVVENYRRYADTLGVDMEKMVLTRQVHKDHVHIAREKDFGAMVMRDCELPEADALITDMPGVTLVKFSADCPVIYLLDKKRKAAGLVHSGWRSTAMDIVGKTVSKMTEIYGSKPSDMIAAIGPCIEVCCFEVGNEVAKIFREGYGEDVIERGHEKPHVDLKKVLKMQLGKAGIAEESIAAADMCTGCNLGLFHSYRITQGKCGLSIGSITII
jgi:YfiH family protein